MSERLLDNYDCNVQNGNCSVCIGGADTCLAYCNNILDAMKGHLVNYQDTIYKVIYWNY